MEIMHCSGCGVRVSKSADLHRTDDGGIYCAKCSALYEQSSSALLAAIDDRAIRKPADGTMKFYFCETCGKRVTDLDLAIGEGRDKKLKGIYCKGCAESVMTMEMNAINIEKLAKSKQSRTTPPHDQDRPRDLRRSSGGHARPRPSAQRQPQGDAEPKKNPSRSSLLFVLGTVMIGIGGIAAIFAMKKGSGPDERATRTVQAGQPERTLLPSQQPPPSPPLLQTPPPRASTQNVHQQPVIPERPVEPVRSPVSAVASPVKADDPFVARIDLDGTAAGVQIDKLSAVGGEGTNADWLGEAKNKCYLAFSFPAAKEWQRGEFSFKAAKDGAVSMMLMGVWARDETTKELKPLWVFIDDMSSGGTALKSGDFESAAQWEPWGDGERAGRLVTDESSAHSGKGCAKVWHNGRLVQELNVKAGVEVTVSFWFRADSKSPPSPKPDLVQVKPDDFAARIDLDGTTTGTELAVLGGDGMNADWLGEAKNKCYLAFGFPASREWQRGELSFKASKDGEITMILMGACVRDDRTKEHKPVWVFIDDITIKGAALKSGDFETAAVWESWGEGAMAGRVVTEGGAPRSGANCARVWHNGRLLQKINVKAGVEVTVSLWFMADTKFPPKPSE
jgi:hypothetical protein